MAPRRSGRRSVSAYKKGDYIEYQYKGSTVTGKLIKKSTKGTTDKPIWVVTPSDRRRKNEDIPEKALGKIIDAQEAMNNRGPKLKKGSNGNGNGSGKIARELSQTSSNSDGSLDQQHQQSPPSLTAKRKSLSGGGGKGSSSGEEGSSNNKKRKGSDDGGMNDRSAKNRKTVTFSQDSNGTAAAATTTSSQRKGSKSSGSRLPHKKSRSNNSKTTAASTTRIGTRSTRGSGTQEPILLPELPIKRNKKLFKTKKVKKDENVKIVKMLTGTLYLYRGDRPRAEFVRCK